MLIKTTIHITHEEAMRAMLKMTDLDFELIQAVLLDEYPHFEGYEDDLLQTLNYTNDLLGGDLSYGNPEEMKSVYNTFLNSVSLYVGVDNYLLGVITHTLQEYLVESVQNIDIDRVWGEEDLKQILSHIDMGKERLSERDIQQLCKDNITDETINDLIELVVHEISNEAMQLTLQYYVEELVISGGKLRGSVDVKVDLLKFTEELINKSIEFNTFEDLCLYLSKNYKSFLVNKNGDER